MSEQDGRSNPGVDERARPAPPHARHFLALDGLRGVAALAVMGMHCGLWFTPGGAFTHAYLAVDFFFLLSGFVIAHAYERKLADGRLKRVVFMLTRLARLYPLILLGVLVSAGFLLTRYASGRTDLPLQAIIQAVVGGLTLMPILTFNPLSNEAYPVDGPVWSLFFELASNALYVLIFPLLRGSLLALVVAIGAGSLLAVDFAYGNLDLGAAPRDFWCGAARVGFGFFAGVMLYRLDLAQRIRLPAIGPLLAAVVLLLVFCEPRSWPLRAGFDAACALFLFPVLLLGCVRHQPRGVPARLCKISGDLSYPIYVFQRPMLWWLTSAFLALHLARLPLPAPGVLAAVIVCAASFLALKLWDEPIRNRAMSALRNR